MLEKKKEKMINLLNNQYSVYSVSHCCGLRKTKSVSDIPFCKSSIDHLAPRFGTLGVLIYFFFFLVTFILTCEINEELFSVAHFFGERAS